MTERYKSVLGQTLDVKEDTSGDAPKGLVTARIATTGVKDLDGDVIVTGAFGQQNVKVAAYGHNWQVPPIGKGVVYEKGNEAILESQFFLGTDNGKQTFLVVKELGSEGEWSFGFRVLKGRGGELDGETVYYMESLQMWEASPVMKGASINTGTLEAKGFWPGWGNGENTMTMPSADDIGAAIAKHLAVPPPATPVMPSADDIGAAVAKAMQANGTVVYLNGPSAPVAAGEFAKHLATDTEVTTPLLVQTDTDPEPEPKPEPKAEAEAELTEEDEAKMSDTAHASRILKDLALRQPAIQ